MWNESYKIDIPSIDDQHQELFDLLEVLIHQIDANSPKDIFYSHLDDIYMKLLIHFNYENNIMRATHNSKYDEHIGEHNKALKSLSTLYVDSINGQVTYNEIVQFLQNLIGHHLDDFDLGLMGEEEFTLAIENLKVLPGGIIVLTYEHGHFVKMFGEVNEELMAMLINKIKITIDNSATQASDWGEVIDVRSWDLLTHKSFELAKSNSTNESRAFSIYIIGDSKANEYIIRNFTKNQICDTWLTENLMGVLRLFSEKKYNFGKIVHSECIGNTEFI